MWRKALAAAPIDRENVVDSFMGAERSRLSNAGRGQGEP
jgi:hypothetical protein